MSFILSCQSRILSQDKKVVRVLLVSYCFFDIIPSNIMEHRFQATFPGQGTTRNSLLPLTQVRSIRHTYGGEKRTYMSRAHTSLQAGDRKMSTAIRNVFSQRGNWILKKKRYGNGRNRGRAELLRCRSNLIAMSDVSLDYGTK